jgi:hypothetical protein
MRLRFQRVALVCIFFTTFFVWAQDKPAGTGADWTETQKIDFLLHAAVVANKHTTKGITDPWRLTLSDGKMKHDGSFQSVDEYKAKMVFDDGHTEFNFRDSYHYNVAAYEVAKLIGMDDMVPVTVERKWNDMKGSLSWWIPDVAMDEGERLQKKTSPPDVDRWNKQMYKIRVLDELVFDTDDNLTNVLITTDWNIWRVDFSRAFRLYKELLKPKDLVMCDRKVFDKLKQLNEARVVAATRNQLSKDEVKALMARRDKIVAFFEKLAAEKGTSEAFY